MGDITKRPPIFMGGAWLGQPTPTPPPYSPKNTLGLASQLGMYTGGAGLIVASAQTALTPHKEGGRAVFTKFGSSIWVPAVMGFTFAGVTAATANIRGRDDPLNMAVGGCSAGFLTGVRTGNLASAFGTCVLLGGAAGLVGVTGTTFFPHKGRTWQEREEERKSHLQYRDPLLDS